MPSKTPTAAASARGRSGRQNGSSSNSTRPSTPPAAQGGGVRSSGGQRQRQQQPPLPQQQQSGRSSRVSQVEESHSVESHDSAADVRHDDAPHTVAHFKPIAGSDVDAFQTQLNTWFAATARDLNAAYSDMVTQISKFEEELRGRYGPRVGAPLPPPLRFGQATPSGGVATNRVGGVIPPPPAPTINTANGSSFSITAGPGGKDAPAMSYDALLEEVEAEQHQSQYSPNSGFAASGRFTTPLAPQSTTRVSQGVIAPTLLLGLGGSSNPSPMAQSAVGIASGRETAAVAWHVLVEFKRSKVIYESESYVPAGQFVVVGGDRGEDIGHVAHCWSGAHPDKAPPASALLTAERSVAGSNRVQRIATAPEVAQLQGMQSELEARARDVAQQKVTEHGLPMRIVDAEYQFDRKKLTFYYQAHQRLDFRVLVRDLYKTFRARIWMELDPHFAQQHPLIGNLVAGNGTPSNQDLFP